jgi:hypothetical protein
LVSLGCYGIISHEFKRQHSASTYRFFDTPTLQQGARYNAQRALAQAGMLSFIGI